MANIQEVTDQAMFAQYRAAAPKTEAAFGGRAIGRGAPVKIDASTPAKGEFVIIEFCKHEGAAGLVGLTGLLRGTAVAREGVGRSTVRD